MSTRNIGIKNRRIIRELDKVAQIYDALEGEARDDEGNFPAVLRNLIEQGQY
jgi:hypothetical protein